MNVRVRISILTRSIHPEFLREFTTGVWSVCSRFEECDQFVSEGANMPEGFCSWAWCDIQKYVLTLARGGDFVGVKPGAFVTCCTDGFRPVFFKLERLED